MSAPPIRPRFELELATEPDVVMEQLRERLPDDDCCAGVSVGRHAELFVPRGERRLWSPHLSVTAEQRRGGGTRMLARFGPHPQLWTFYMFLAFGLGFVLLLGVTWGYAQWAMGVSMWALLSVPVVALLAATLYLASLAGQRLGHEQMTALRDTLNRLVEDHD